MYTCIQSYRSMVGAKRFYTIDEKISDLDYEVLPEHEKTHWKSSSFLDSVLSDSEELPSIGAIVDAVDNLFNSDSGSETKDESSDFGGFDGGDFGGGGASGEF